MQFFPDVKPEQKSGAEYFHDALVLAEESEKLGFTHVRIVEHYFYYYVGYSPNPMLFLAAAAGIVLVLVLASSMAFGLSIWPV